MDDACTKGAVAVRTLEERGEGTRRDGVDVLLFGPELARHDPMRKGSEWIAAREPALDEVKARGCDEGLLSVGGTGAEGSRVLEGLSSNFVVERTDGTLQCAPDADVLPGTMLKALLSVAESAQHPVLREAPSVVEAEEGQWRAAWVCSTSRWLLRVAQVLRREADGGQVLVDFRELSASPPVAELISQVVDQGAGFDDEAVPF